MIESSRSSILTCEVPGISDDLGPAVRHSYKKLNLYLIKPSKYDEDGYVIRYLKGVLPSNTLACLNGLSQDVRKRQVLGIQLKWNIEIIDETVQKVNVQKILRASKQKYSKSIVCLAGVQSNQFPRAADLALEFRQAGIDVLIGGFHVSGIISTLPKLSPEIAVLRDAGVTIVAGEIEGHWDKILRDSVQGKLQPVYNFLKCPPDLSSAPMPEIPKNLLRRFAVSRFATLDCGRGCPFECTFCTVINVQGRKMRFRSVPVILDWIRANYLRHNVTYYFFTDDNFSRNKNWEAIFDGLIRMRREENIPISFMMQVDTLSHLIPNFASKAGQAGCSQVFIGMESLNEENLKAAGKKQNHVENYRSMILTYQREKIATHLAYIIGFPFDSAASVRQDMAKMQQELIPEQASFFMLTPLPGSVDYSRALNDRKNLDADLNNFDSFHETCKHAQMKPGEWTQVYDQAWSSFYGPENMKRILRNVPLSKYWDVFFNFIWYKNAIQVEKGHPMLNGFVRLKGRHLRRRIYPMESRAAYWKRRAGDVFRMLAGWARLAFEMEEVWLATRRRSELEERVLLELGQFQQKAREWKELRLSELQMLYRRAASAMEKSSVLPNVPHRLRIPSRLQLWFKKWDFFGDSLTSTRTFMSGFWIHVGEKLKRGRIAEIRFHQVLIMSMREAALLGRFFLSLLGAMKTTV